MTEISVREVAPGRREVSVTGEGFVSRRSVETTYPDELIDALLKIRGAAWLCDEIARDEAPTRDLELSVLAFVSPEELRGKRLLDFGAGAGASTMRLARMLPETDIVAVELEQDFIEVAQMRARHYGLPIEFHQSPSPDRLPDIGEFDAIMFGAVYEHLLPAERAPLLAQLWERLRPGGYLFINELPYRWFPIDWHTTRMPLINYLPRWLVMRVIRWAPRYVPGRSWEEWLRRGIRGGSQRMITRQLPGAVPLTPSREGLTSHADLWFETAYYVRNVRFRRALRRIFRVLDRVEPMEPMLTLAFRKG